MTHSDIEERLNDYLDGLLTGEQVRELEDRLERHPEDRALLDRIRALKRAAGELPRRVEPGRDLWPGIRAEVESRPAGAGETRTETGPAQAGPGRTVSFPAPRHAAIRPWWGALAASVILLLGGALVALQVWQGGAADPAGGPVASRASEVAPGAPIEGRSGLQPAAQTVPGTSMDMELAAAEQEFMRASGQLMAVLEERRDRIAPETLAFVEENLRIINEAIEEVRNALAADPGNPVHGHALAAMYKQKMQLLWVASRLTTEI